MSQAYERAGEILTSGETIEYIAVANRGSLTHAPDVAVASNKRIMLFRKKVLGKVEQDDFNWRDVRSATMKDGRNGVTFTLESIQGWQMSVESLPKGQAWRLYELSVEHSERLAESLRLRTGPFDPALAMPDLPVTPAPTTELPPSYYAPPAHPTFPQPPAQGHLPSLPRVQQPPSYAEQPALQAPEPAQPQPTPESVLQTILQQAAQAGGAPTRPMPLSAAAFQAPVADAQPVTFSEPSTDMSMRSMPRLSSLEQIAVFSGPLTGSLPTIHDSAPRSPYEPRTVQSGSGAPGQSPDGEGEPKASSAATVSALQAGAAAVAGAQSEAYPDGPMPLPGSMSSGPLLEAAYEYDPSAYPGELLSGGLETQQLYSHRAGELADRITSTNLSNGHEEPLQAGGRTRRPAVSRQPAAPSPKTRQTGTTPAARVNGRADADDPVLKMKKLKEMLDAGLIDGDDYEAKKADILSRL
ncbi:MAG TPA: PH domain-containing protein [Chloroflexia bacterium]|nr:PH domain-containing protein [Chloroflexia bacterium]